MGKKNKEIDETKEKNSNMVDLNSIITIIKLKV